MNPSAPPPAQPPQSPAETPEAVRLLAEVCKLAVRQGASA